MTAWKVLGLECSLALDNALLETRFRELSKGAHPDAGGEDGVFERLREARDQLLDPARRLDAWLRAQGVEVAHSGAVPKEVAEMFLQVGQMTSTVDAWLQRGLGLTSGIGRAIWKNEGFALKAQLEELIGKVDNWEARVVQSFTEIEADSDLAGALAARGELGFLRKWRAELRGRYGKIWEGLV